MKPAMFSVNDVIVALDKKTLYEAKVLKILESDSGWHYYIHYNRWARHYDTWIGESFVSSPDDEKRKKLILDAANASATDPGSKNSAKDGKAKKAKISHTNESKTETVFESSDSQSQNGPVATSTVTSSDGAPRKKQRFSTDPSKSANSTSEKKEIKQLAEAELMIEEASFLESKIALPIPLQKHLVDDWTLVTKVPQRLVSLPKPAQTTVSSIIAEFVAFKSSKKEDAGNEDAESFFAQDLLQGMALFFSRVLPIFLLYRQERLQLQLLQEAHPDLEFCDMYGVEHLLRLFSILPRLFSSVQCGHMDKIISTINTFMKFLQKHSNKFLSLQHYVLSEGELQRLGGPAPSSSSSSLPSSMEVEAADPPLGAGTAGDNAESLSSEQVAKCSAEKEADNDPDLAMAVEVEAEEEAVVKDDFAETFEKTSS